MLLQLICLLGIVALSSGQQVDSSKFMCRQPGPVKGPCNEKVKRWYHNFQSGECFEFEFGGCNGNYNNFETKEDCERQCKGNSGAKFHSTKKSGNCVNYPNEPHWTPWGLCTHMCAQYDDASCPGEQKCCFNGCGFQCVHPDSASWGLKNGKCPDSKVHTLAKLQSSHPSFQQYCMTDNSCAGRGKCCPYPGVGNVCVPALEDLESPEKPGTCPTKKTPQEVDCGGYQRIPCEKDSDCKDSAKCCDLRCGKECSVPAELITTTTTTPLPPVEEDEEGEEVCPLMGKRCGDGETPYMFCAQDSDCSSGQKCCHDGCGYVCAEPFWIPKLVMPSENGTTGSPTTMMMTTTTEPPTTTTTTTTTTATTTTLSTTPQLEDGLSPYKVFGWCPPPSLCNATNFYLDCVTDVKCPFDKKCCFNGCGYECIIPQLPKFLQGASSTTSTPEMPERTTTAATGTTTANADNNNNVDVLVDDVDINGKLIRRGFCGLEKKHCGGSGPATGETYFYQTCGKDGDCADESAKCCFDGCGYECQKPVFLKPEEVEAVVDATGSENPRPEEKPGVCPPPGISNAVVTLCRNDADCYGAYKCCNTMGGRECVPASLPVVDNRPVPSNDINNDNNNENGDKEDSMSENMIVETPSTSSSHAYCHVTSDIPLPSGQSPVVKGIVYLHETVFWGLNVKVKMSDLPVPRGLPRSRRFLFKVQVLDSVDDQLGCMFASVHPGGDLGVMEANSNGVIDDEAAKKKGFTVMENKPEMDNSPSKNIVNSVLAISTVNSNQRVGCCRVRQCHHGCCQGPYTGHCMAFLKRFYFDWTTGKCREFVYGGCGAQENNFKSEEECLRKCATYRPSL